MQTFTAVPPPEGYKGDVIERPLIPDGTVLPARVLEVVQKAKGPAGRPFLDPVTKQEIQELSWKFEVEYEGQNIWVWGDTGVDFIQHPDCRFFSWVQAIFGTELPAGFVVDLSHLVGEALSLEVGQRSYVKKGETEADRKYVNFARDVLPKGATSAPAPPAIPADEPF